MTLVKKFEALSANGLNKKFESAQKISYVGSYEWENLRFVNHIHLINTTIRKNSAECIPWSNTENNENEILDFCKESLFEYYKSHMLTLMTSCNNTMLMDLIQKFLRVVELFGIYLEFHSASSLYTKLLRCLFKKGCDDPAVFQNLWYCICEKSEHMKFHVFDSLIGKNSISESAGMLQHILEIAQRSNFNFWGTWIKRNELEGCDFCPVTHAMLNANFDQLTVLIQYGFKQSEKRISTYDRYFFSSINYDYMWFRKPLDRRNFSNRSAILIEVLLFLEVLSHIQANQKRRSALIKCFKLLWSTSSNPPVTKWELQKEVCRRFQRDPPRRSMSPATFPRTLCRLLKLCDVYDAIVKPRRDRRLLNPHSLQHLCKCSVREALQTAWNLPHGIQKLQLPNRIKAYVSLYLAV